ncbi:MAG: sulfite exporter TauE/SafE family protein [Clostridia bacterium]|nr:sulfite exporter TauE/SafE family protein [Clostridia bacterium]
MLALAFANPIVGALSMLLFSLGTVPLMLVFGSLVSALGKCFTRMVMNIGAVLVTVLCFAMLTQGGTSDSRCYHSVCHYYYIGYYWQCPKREKTPARPEYKLLTAFRL